MAVFPLNDEVRWCAVQSRSSNNTFVYAVESTKIFCRPNCPGRLARRANVAFFDRPAEAKKAGFRACKRCKPDEPTIASASIKVIAVDGGEIDIFEPGEQNARRRAAARAKQVIIRSSGKMSWKDVAAEVGLSSRYLFDAFKAVEGVTPGRYSEMIRQDSTALVAERSQSAASTAWSGENRAVPSVPLTPMDNTVADISILATADPLLFNTADDVSFNFNEFNTLPDDATLWALLNAHGGENGCDEEILHPQNNTQSKWTWDSILNYCPNEEVLGMHGEMVETLNDYI